MGKNTYNPIKAGISYTLGNVLIKGIPFFTLPIFTRIMNPVEFGIYNTYLAYEAVVAVLLGFGLVGTVRVAKVEYKDRFESYISAIYGLQIILTFITGILSVCVLSYMAVFNQKVIFILLCNCLCTQFYNIASAKFAINGQVIYNLAISFLMTILNVGISLFLCLFPYSSEPATGRILGTFCAALIVTMLIIIQQLNCCSRLYNKTYWIFAFSMGWPLILHSLSLIMLGQCDKILIQRYVGNAEVGIYGLAVIISGIISVLISAADNAWAPWFFTCLEEKKYDAVYKKNNLMLSAFTVFCLMSILVMPEIIRIFAAKEYTESIYIIPILIVSLMFNFYYLIPVNFEYYCKNTKFIAKSTVITTVLNVILVYIFLKIFGYIGAAYATCLSRIILFYLHWHKSKQLSRFDLVDVRLVVGWLILSAIVISFVFWSVDKIVIRYIAILFFLLSSCFYRKRLCAMYKS